jgi:hypothetical protein
MGNERVARTSSRKWACIVAASLLFVCVTAGAGITACTTDGDGDGICDDVDNCVGIANATQQDSNGDGVGDACELNLTRVKLRRKNRGPGDKSAMRGEGFFVLGSGEVFDGSGGLSFNLKERIGLDVTQGFAPGECEVAGPKIKCKTSARGGLAYFKPLASTPNVLKFSFVFRRLGLEGEFDGPVQVTLSDPATGITRVGTIADCLINLIGLRCRQF